MLRFLADLSVEETARTLGCTPATVKTHRSRARAVDLSDPKNWQLRSRSSKVSPAPPRRPAPSGLAGLTQVAIQPDGIDSCIQCFVVDLYLDEQHPIVAIRLDRFAP